MHNERAGLRNFHEGEARLQAEWGVDTALFDRMVDGAFQPELSDSEVRFVDQRTFSVAATIDGSGRPWASPLVGRAGELFTVEDRVTVRLMPPAVDGDPLRENIDASGHLGVLYFDPSRRRRAKSLGHGTIEADGSITYRMHRNFGLCNKYIFKRSHEIGLDASAPQGRAPRSGSHLEPADRVQLQAADTIFLASQHVSHGADATHRGGPPGFVTVVDETTLAIPDYFGNGMFQTLGNVLLDDRIGLLAVDFETGRSVQLTGRGSIKPSAVDDRYSQRSLHITIDEVRSTWPDIGRWTDIEAFDLQPGLRNPATPFL